MISTAAKKTLWAPLALLLLSACAGMGKPGANVHYYALEYDPPVASDPASRVPMVIKVRRFGVSPLYNSDRIIYRDAAFSRNEYYYHRWRANPGDLVTQFLKRDLQRSSRFKAVFGFEAGLPGDYLLEGSVDEFLEQDQADSREALLTITAALLKANEPDVSRSVIFQKTYRGQASFRQQSPKSLAAAMSRAMAQVSEAVIDSVLAALQPLQQGQTPMEDP